MSELLQYLPRAGYTSMPWRNGAGVTREIARMPARGDTFTWRLSLASISASGPFSPYPGYERSVALVEGRGFRLDINNARACVLAACGDHAIFPGSAQTECTLIDGPCTDLSLMVREPGKINSVTRLCVAAEEMPITSTGGMQAVFVLRGGVACREQSDSLRGGGAVRSASLKVNDTLIVHGPKTLAFRSETPDDASELLLISFTPRPDFTD